MSFEIKQLGNKIAKKGSLFNASMGYAYNEDRFV